MHCQKVRRIFHYYVPNRLLSPEKFAHHAILLVFPIKDEKGFLSDCPLLYQISLQGKRYQDVLNTNKNMSEAHGDSVDQGFSLCNENLIENQDLHSPIENDETPDT